MKRVKTKVVAMAALMALGASVWAGPTSISPKPGVEPVKTSAVPSDAAISGDYVEARTAAVFAGACHYNGEYVTTGRDALMAWSFKSGVHDGVSLAGVQAMAAVTSQANLSDVSTSRKAEIVVDPSATAEQITAV